MPRTLSRTDVVTWNTAGPRASAAFDLTGDGRTALKGSAARYYYIISTTGLPLDNVNPNFTYQAQYTWNDANHDLVFQPGEQTGSADHHLGLDHHCRSELPPPLHRRIHREPRSRSGSGASR